MTNEILLSITIPTYNRANFLDASLGSICKSICKSKRMDIEIVVLDNCSTDNTYEVVKKYSKYAFVRYIKNENNIGPDNNFKKSIFASKGKYLWIFGDDDLVFDDTIKCIGQILDYSDEFGIVHLKAQNFTNKVGYNMLQEFKSFKIYNDKRADFIKEAHTNLTFITSNIVNKSLLDKIDINVIPNNNLVHLYWNIACVILSDTQVILFDKIYAARQFNSGNYNFSEVFGINLNETLRIIEEKYNVKFISKIFRKRLLMYYYPANIVRIRNGLSVVKNKNCFRNLYKIYKENPLFWIFTVSAMWIPKKLGLLMIKFMQKTI